MASPSAFRRSASSRDSSAGIVFLGEKVTDFDTH
jgi:hypothetical protein